jgi:hypothetical protein
VSITRAEICRNGRDTVGALAILYHYWLPPALSKALGKKPTGYVRASARWERDDQSDGALRPGLGERWRWRKREHKTEKKGGKPAYWVHSVLTCWR